MTLNWADWIIVGTVVVSCLLGFKRGLIKEALSVANLGLALFAALNYRDAAAALLAEHIQSLPVRLFLGFIGVFLAVLIVGAAVNFIVGFVVKFSGISFFDRVLGVGFGLARGCLVVLVAVISLSKFELAGASDWWLSSSLIPNFMIFEQWASQSGLDSVAWLERLFDLEAAIGR